MTMLFDMREKTSIILLKILVFEDFFLYRVNWSNLVFVWEIAMFFCFFKLFSDFFFFLSYIILWIIESLCCYIVTKFWLFSSNDKSAFLPEHIGVLLYKNFLNNWNTDLISVFRGQNLTKIVWMRCVLFWDAMICNVVDYYVYKALLL